MAVETKADALSKLLLAYKRYYNITQDESVQPFSALAEFHSHNEQFFLVKAAKVADIDSNEYVFFALQDELTVESLIKLDGLAWETGLSKVIPSSIHRNSDVSLIIIADKISDEAKNAIKKIRHYKSYRFSFWGWSNYSLIAFDMSAKSLAFNRRGKDLKKFFINLL
ncbi:MAG: hypothetical protein J6U06_05100 [Spirochaetaceae bacterium]|nr:hypothetical protein [Spirochaetaceae bacterium]